MVRQSCAPSPRASGTVELNTMEHPLLIIAGPTGVGKTATAVALSQRLSLEVVSADSRQVYRGMDVATGKPSAEERRLVRHHLIDIRDPDERYDAAHFRGDAIAAIAEIRGRDALAAVVGGTGLYLRALLRGLDPAPPADPAYRRDLETVAAREGRRALHERLRREAPELARRLHPNDQVRIIRALERIRAADGPVVEQVRWRHGVPEDRILYIGLTTDRAALYRRLRTRAAAMVGAGLVGEVRTLLDRGYDASLPAMLGIGYRQFVDVVRGKIEEAEAIRRMERDTIRYAKRQWTWFAREPNVHWLDVEASGGPEPCAEIIEARLRSEGLIA